MSKKDQVSIFVPTFNSEITIVETIKSILDQSYENITITIIDNASIDKTVALVKTIKDKRLSIIQNKINIGAEENFNRCLSLSQKKFTSILHADDIYDKFFIEKQVDFFKRNHDVGLVFTEGKMIDSSGKFIRNIEYPSINNKISFLELFKLILKHGNFLICPSAMLLTKVFKKWNIKWNGKKFNTSADLDVWFSISKKICVGLLKEKLIFYRNSDLQVSNIVRGQINEPDFFKLINTYLKKDKLLKDKVTIEDHNSYQALIMRDVVKRSLNLFINKKFKSSLFLIKSYQFKNLNKNIFSNKKNILSFLMLIFLRNLNHRILNKILSKFFKKFFKNF